MNPKQLFVVSTVSREDIADALHDHLLPEGIAPTDSRLTDEFCNDYAKGLYEVEVDMVGRSENAIVEATEKFAKSMAAKLQE